MKKKLIGIFFLAVFYVNYAQISEVARENRVKGSPADSIIVEAANRDNLGSAVVVQNKAEVSQEEQCAVYVLSQNKDESFMTGGYFADPKGNKSLMRKYSQDGILDSSFGSQSNGTEIIQLGGRSSAVNDIITGPNGIIYMAGFSTGKDKFTDVACAAYNQEGVLQTSFGNKGKITTAIGTYNDMINAIVMQSDGKLVAAGYSADGFVVRAVLMRLNSNGSLDSTFGSAGTILNTEALKSGFNTVALQSDGKILAAGYSYESSVNNFYIARYTTAGVLDDTFGQAGLVTTIFDKRNSVIRDIKIASDGTIIAGGFTTDNMGFTHSVIAAYTPNGNLNKQFGTNGIVKAAVSKHDDKINMMNIQSDGKIIVVGFTTNLSTTFTDCMMMRFMPDGLLDGTFGNKGLVITSFGPHDYQMSDVILQANGKIVVVGYNYNESYYKSVLLRYEINGNLDMNFGSAVAVVQSTTVEHSPVPSTVTSPA